MAEEKKVRVIIEKERKGVGCGTAILVVVAIALAVKYWYVTVAILALLLVAVVIDRRRQRRKALRPPSRRGPHDPYLNELSVCAADLEFEEIARNTGDLLGGAPLEANLGLECKNLIVYIHLFANEQLAHQAEVGLRAVPAFRKELAAGKRAVRHEGRLLYVAHAMKGVVDEFSLDELVAALQAIPRPAPIPKAPPQPRQPFRPRFDDQLEALERLDRLRRSGAISPAEYELKKAQLLRGF